MTFTVPYTGPIPDAASVVHWQPTAALRWKGRTLQQLWIGSDGGREWKEIEDAMIGAEDVER